MRLPALAALTAVTLTIGSAALAQTNEQPRPRLDSGTTFAEDRDVRLPAASSAPRFLTLGAPVQPVVADAPAPTRRKLTLGTMPWLTGAYN